MKDSIYTSRVGLSISKGDWDGAQWTLAGYPNEEAVGKQLRVYEFEDIIKHHVDCRGIDFDSESGCFYAYAKTKQRLISFINKIERHFDKANQMYSSK